MIYNLGLFLGGPRYPEKGTLFYYLLLKLDFGILYDMSSDSSFKNGSRILVITFSCQ